MNTRHSILTHPDTSLAPRINLFYFIYRFLFSRHRPLSLFVFSLSSRFAFLPFGCSVYALSCSPSSTTLSILLYSPLLATSYWLALPPTRALIPNIASLSRAVLANARGLVASLYVFIFSSLLAHSLSLLLMCLIVPFLCVLLA